MFKVDAKEDYSQAALRRVVSQGSLRRAVFGGDAQAVQALIDANADIDAKDSDGWTVLHWAALSGYSQIVQVLIDAGADIHSRDNDGWTCLHLTARWGYADPSIALLQAGADLSIANNNSETARDFALSNGQHAWISQIDAWCAANEARIVIDKLLQSGSQECNSSGGRHV